MHVSFTLAPGAFGSSAVFFLSIQSCGSHPGWTQRKRTAALAGAHSLHCGPTLPSAKKIAQCILPFPLSHTVQRLHEMLGFSTLDL